MMVSKGFRWSKYGSTWTYLKDPEGCFWGHVSELHLETWQKSSFTELDCGFAPCKDFEHWARPFSWEFPDRPQDHHRPIIRSWAPSCSPDIEQLMCFFLSEEKNKDPFIPRPLRPNETATATHGLALGCQAHRDS